MVELYRLISYFFDGGCFQEPMVVAYSRDYKPLKNYAVHIRKYPLVRTIDNPEPETMSYMCGMLNNGYLATCAEIDMLRFTDELQVTLFLERPENAFFELVPYDGIVDKKISGIRGKHAKNVYVPHIVDTLIYREQRRIASELGITFDTLKKLILYMSNSQNYHMSSAAISIYHSARVVEDIINGKLDLTDDIGMRHPVIFCGEAEYRERIHAEIISSTLDREYRDRLARED